MQRHVIIRGLADKQIRREMMSDTGADKSLKRLIANVESKEAGNRAHDQCHTLDPTRHTGDNLDASSYRQQGKRTHSPHPTPNSLDRLHGTDCTNCGGHHLPGRQQRMAPTAASVGSQTTMTGSAGSRPVTGRNKRTEGTDPRTKRQAHSTTSPTRTQSSRPPRQYLTPSQPQ